MIVVLDTSAFLAASFGEVGAARVRAVRETAAVSSVSLAEVVARLLDAGLSDLEATAAVAAFGARVHPFTETQGVRSGQLRALTRARGLSLGDRCCLALAVELGAPVLTADRAWAGLDIGVTVEVIR